MADEIGDLALSKFIHVNSGQIREFFDIEWRPAPRVEGRICEPGHQFEWGWLLLRWSKIAGRDDAARAALRMIDAAESSGVDAVRGVAINALLDDFSVFDNGARLWPQTERIKAAMMAAEVTEDEKYLRMAVAAVRGLLRYFDEVQPGLWRDKLISEDVFINEASPESSMYHIASAINEFNKINIKGYVS